VVEEDEVVLAMVVVEPVEAMVIGTPTNVQTHAGTKDVLVMAAQNVAEQVHGVNVSACHVAPFPCVHGREPSTVHELCHHIDDVTLCTCINRWGPQRSNHELCHHTDGVTLHLHK